MVKISLTSILGTDENPIKEGHLFAAGYCKYSFFLRYLDDTIVERKLPMIGYHARKPYVMQRIWGNKAKRKPGLFKIDDPSIRFQSPDSFASAVSGSWRYSYWKKGAMFHGKPLAWHSFDEKRNTTEHVYSACFNYYQNLIEEGYTQRLLAERESPILARKKEHAFHFDGLKFVVRFDEVWKGMIIRKIRVQSSRITQKNLPHDHVLTMQFLGYCLASENYGLREMFGIENELIGAIESEDFGSGVRVQLHELVNGRVFETQRTRESVDALRTRLEEVSDMIEKEQFPSNHNNCWSCRFNVEDLEANVPCDRRNPNSYANRIL